MVDGKILVEKLIRYAERFLHLNKRDEIYFRNLLLREFNLEKPCENALDLNYIDSLDVPDTLICDLEQYAVDNNLIAEEDKGLYSTYIFGLLSPLPSKVNEEFLNIKSEQGIEKACEYFYNLSVKNNYVQKTAISKNLKWKFEDGEKHLEITINLSKPEKSNKDIAKLLTAPKGEKYPACLLCKENEGFKGNPFHPARENIRTISLNLGGEDWFVQYSPYAYYDEHLIAISNKHCPMNVDRQTVNKLVDFVDFFPHYFIGSNAALPIVGGSILNHEHYQGGGHLMPLQKSGVKVKLSSKFADVKVGICDWYNSVLRVESKNKLAFKQVVGDIIEGWKTFTNEECGIYAFTGETPHNACSPICRKVGDAYIMDIILRNNRTDETYPDGIFHAHPEYHNIKKEGIGLIEAMGLFILPGRLKRQLNEIAQILCGEQEFDKSNQDLAVHFDMIEKLMKNGKQKDFDAAYNLVVDEVNNVCKNILFNTAVFKDDDAGKRGFMEFAKHVGLK